MTYVITFLLFAGIVLVLLGLREAQHAAPESATVRLSKLRSRREELAAGSVSERERDKEFIKQEEQRAAVRKTTFLPSLSKFFSSNVLLARLEEELVLVRSQWRASELLAGSLLMGLAVFILLSSMGSKMLALSVAFGCLFLPWLYVKRLRARYYRQFDEQLADTLMLVSNSLKAGFSFLQSIEMVAREAQPPIADEFGRVTQEIAVGVSITDALDNLGKRITAWI
jgi:tight adherence protein B